MRNVRRLSMVCTAAALAVVLPASTAAAAETVTITPADGAEWYFSSVHTDENGVGGPTGGTGGIVAAPGGTSPWGPNNFELDVDDATQKARLMTDLLDGELLSDLDGVTYSTNKTGNTGYAPSINVIIDPAGGDDFATLVWEANKAGGDVQDGVWQDWDTEAGDGWWSPSIQPFNSAQAGSNANPTDLQTIAAYFGAGSTIIGFAVNVGRHGPMTAFVDGIGITLDGETTIYDVEPYIPTKDDCKNGGWATNFEPGTYKNQGQCVSSFASKGRAGGR